MSNDKLYDGLLAYITEHGETGVNVLARELDVPLSTMQRYLEKQTYFRKTINRKWDIPNNVDADIKSNTMTLMVDSVETALKLLNSQLDEIQSSVQNALMPVNTLKRAVIATNLPVAAKSVTNDPSIDKLLGFATMFQKGIKQSLSKIPEEYQDLLLNLDIIKMCVYEGMGYVNSSKSRDLTGVILGETDTLSEESLKMLEEYQKES